MTSSQKEAQLTFALEKLREKRAAFLEACAKATPLSASTGTRQRFTPLDHSDSKRRLSPLRFCRDGWTWPSFSNWGDNPALPQAPA